MTAGMPIRARVVERIAESSSIVTLRLALVEPGEQARYRFAPGQFNMLYVHGVGEVAISISSDPERPEFIDHTIRSVGRVTRVLGALPAGAMLGLRGPFGRPWPLPGAEGSDVLVITGGLGCAPVAAVINYVLRRRERFGRLTIVQGVKHADDLIWQDRYADWGQLPNTRVLLAADQGGPLWPGHVGQVTEVFDRVEIDPARTFVAVCGPEAMMRSAIPILIGRGLPQRCIHLSMERNMQCATGHCGHCMFGAPFLCRQGPIFAWPEVERLLQVRGF